MLFLDEVELGADEQAMLLKAVKKRFYPFGSDQQVSSGDFN